MMRLARGQKFLALFVAGALLPLSLAPFYLWPIGIFSIAVLFRTLQQQTLKQALAKSFVFGFGMFFAGVSWVYVSIHEHGFIPAPLALIATTLFCLFIALLFALPFALSALIPQKPASWLIGLPAIWVLSEWFRSWIFTGFPWLFSGYAHTETWLSGWAPIGGVIWLSFLTALTAAIISQLTQPDRNQRSVKLASLAIIATVVSGYFLQQVSWTSATGKNLSVVLVQPNTDQHKKWVYSEQQGILKQLESQTQPHWGADIIIWPEAAIPTTPKNVWKFLAELEQQAKVNQTTLITGIPTYHPASQRYFNSLMMLGENRGQYDKTRLVPFGEYVPFASQLRGLIKFFNLPMSFFSLGDADQPLLTVAGEKIATAICYEIVYPNLVASMAREATALLTVSNDAWFGRSIAPRQHMQMARMRALENAKPMMRGTSNGVTALVDHHGEITAQIEQFSTGELSGTIAPRSGQTVFSQAGSWPIVILSLLICGGLIIRRRITAT
jgi:apolipoprotein N-acyltransferase